jgi:hypothetical protein
LNCARLKVGKLENALPISRGLHPSEPVDDPPARTSNIPLRAASSDSSRPLALILLELPLRLPVVGHDEQLPGALHEQPGLSDGIVGLKFENLPPRHDWGQQYERPSRVTQIKDRAFLRTWIESVSNPQSVEILGSSAFFHVTGSRR